MKGNDGRARARGALWRPAGVQPLTPSCPSLLLQGEEGASEDPGQEAQQQYLRGQDKGET